jgi:hypothetical protein
MAGSRLLEGGMILRPLRYDFGAARRAIRRTYPHPAVAVFPYEEEALCYYFP